LAIHPGEEIHLIYKGAYRRLMWQQYYQYYDDHVNGIRLHLRTVATNRSTVHPQVIYEHREPWWNTDKGTKTPDSHAIALWQSYQHGHQVAKQEELAKEMINFSLMKYHFHT
jgi:hypothetical protein